MPWAVASSRRRRGCHGPWSGLVWCPGCLCLCQPCPDSPRGGRGGEGEDEVPLLARTVKDKGVTPARRDPRMPPLQLSVEEVIFVLQD